jgi:hypothetical protein
MGTMQPALRRRAPAARLAATASKAAALLSAAAALLLGCALAAPGVAAAEHRPPGPVTVRPPVEPEAPVALAAAEDTLITTRTTSANAMGLTIYNNGFFGNNLASRDPSLEYPLGSAEEHLVRAGLWVGGLASATGELADAETLVTTATVDGYYGSTGRETESEFFPAASEIMERSILPNSRYFDPANAKSEQDLICTYIDRHQHATELHKPLNIAVTQEILQFSFEPFDAIIIVNFQITNVHPTNLLFDLYAGFYAEFASGWKDGHDEWPPSGWFSKKDVAYVDSLRLVTEHHYLLDGGNCPSWIGCQLLGTRPIPLDEKTVSFNMWNWDPSGAQPETPDLDWERYLTLSNGSTDPTRGVEAPNNDPVTLLSVGPLGTGSFADSTGKVHWFLEPGAAVTVAFALVGGIPSPAYGRNAEEDIAFNAGWAQTAFDLNYSIPVPPPSPSLFVEAFHNKLRLWWDDLPLGFIDPKSREQDFEGFRVYVSERSKTEGFAELAEFDLPDSLRFDTGLSAILAPEPLRRATDSGDTLEYRFRYDLDDVRDGFKYWVSVTSFDTGTPEIGPLESGLPQNRALTIPGARRDETPGGRVTVFPNPYHGDAAWDEELLRDRYLWFVGLPRRCKIRIYTLAGDHVRTLDFDGDTYGATDVRGIYDPTDVRNPTGDVPVMSGYMAAWDLTTRKDQAVATGLYIFSVENLETGAVERGKFMIMK